MAANLLLAGCVSSLLASKVVAPPNQSGIKPLFADWEVLKHAPEVFADSWTIDVGPPAARISVAAVEPGDYGMVYELRLSYPQGQPPHVDFFNSYWKPASQRTRRQGPPRGTIVLLHGYLQNKNYVTPWAVRLAQAGFRCLVVDLRGHGHSTGAHISFGAFESRDLSQVLDDLGRRGWDVSHVGLLGVSYGASVALVTAGRDPRVASVVAFEPFSSAQKAVPELMRAAFASEAKGISDRQFAAAHAKEAKYGGFAWADADIPAALARTRAPVLFIHGERDHWVSPEHSRALMKVAPPGSKLRLVPRDNHVSLPLQIEPFADEIVAWLDAGIHAR
jgi:pimeloyl-ACP methyl ester carboxylesterase